MGNSCNHSTSLHGRREPAHQAFCRFATVALNENAASAEPGGVEFSMSDRLRQ
jgi:hypothetical protein